MRKQQKTGVFPDPYTVFLEILLFWNVLFPKNFRFLVYLKRYLLAVMAAGFLSLCWTLTIVSTGIVVAIADETQKTNTNMNTPYAQLVQESARKHNVDASLIAAIMAVESAGNPAASSYAGAMGLMQVMPTTAAETCPGDDMFNPVDNINCGTKYLRFLLDHFDGDTDLAIMGYHGGPGNAAKGGRQVDKGYLVSVKAAMSRQNGTAVYPNVVAAAYCGEGFQRTGTKGVHDGGARDYTSISERLCTPISGLVTANSVDALGNTYLRISNETESVLMMHGQFPRVPGEWVKAGDIVGTEASIGNSTHSHLHIQFKVNGVAQQLP